MKNISLRQLKIFEAVARHLSFSRAAAELHLSQPAVSMQVRALEEDAGLRLTEQVGKRIFTTDAGAELARHARLIAQQLAAAEDALAAIRGLASGHLSVGVVSTAKYFAPRLLAQFRARHPGIALQLNVNNRQAIVRQLGDNEIDLAIMGTPPLELETAADTFAINPLVFIAAPDHALARKRRLAPADIAGETFLVREAGSGTRGAMERYFIEQDLAPAHRFEMSSNETIKQAVMAGMGISFISEHTIRLELDVGLLVRLPVVGTPLMRRWHVVRLARKPLSPLAEAFKNFLCHEAATLMKANQGANSSRRPSTPEATSGTSTPETTSGTSIAPRAVARSANLKSSRVGDDHQVRPRNRAERCKPR
ncbi:MAG: LysR family transcriptional regulator [Betaproteobacteria bacterium]|nr:LysR family transcriptional regulator [Betaproteobacteria bacterium]